MSKFVLEWPLEVGETLLWQGRPAPRCYTFRNWKLALAGTTLFLGCSFWMFLGFQLSDSGDYFNPLVIMTAPLVIASFLMGPGHLLLSRWRWNNIYYALSDRRVIMRGGLFQVKVRSYPRETVFVWQQKCFGQHLASIRLHRGEESSLVFDCLEYPENLTQHLPQRATDLTDGESV